MGHAARLATSLLTLAALSRAATTAPASTQPGPAALNTWLVLGPFAEQQAIELARDILDQLRPAPVEGQPGGGEAWAYFDDRLFSRNYDDYQDLFSFYRLRRGRSIAGRVVYAHTYLFSPAAREAQLRIGGDIHVRAWLNGKGVADLTAMPRRDAAALPISLEAGWNRLLVRIANQQEGRLGFYARICDASGAALPDVVPSPDGPAGPLAVATRGMPGEPNKLPVAWAGWPYVGLDATGDTDTRFGPLRRPDLTARAAAFQFTARGGQPPYRWEMAEGPDWLRLTTDGRLIGSVPEAFAAGQQPITVRVTDSADASGLASYAITVRERPNRWFESARLTALIHCPERIPPQDPDAFAALMKRQGYGLGMIISYNNGDHMYRWPSPFAPQQADLAAVYKKALEAAGVRFGMYIGNLDGANHRGADGPLLVLEDAVKRYRPAAFWFDWAGWDGTSLDAAFSVIRTLSPETLIVLNGWQTRSNGDWDVICLEGWGCWGDKMWDTWPSPLAWPKRTPMESWRLVADPFFEHSKDVHPDWQEYLRVQLSLIGEGYVANIDHSPTIRQPITSIDQSVVIQCHHKMAAWANPAGLPPLHQAYTNVDLAPLPRQPWGYAMINLARETIYLHVIKNPRGKAGLPADGKLIVEGWPPATAVKRAVCMNTGQAVRAEAASGRLSIDLGSLVADPVDTIIALTLSGPLN